MWISAGNFLVFFFFLAVWERVDFLAVLFRQFFPFHSFIVLLKISKKQMTQQQLHNNQKKKKNKEKTANVNSFVC